MISSYEDETNKCTWRYVNILHYKCGKPPTRTCFSHFIWSSSGRYYIKYIFKIYENPMHRCKTVSFKLYGLIYMLKYKIDKINSAISKWIMTIPCAAVNCITIFPLDPSTPIYQTSQIIFGGHKSLSHHTACFKFCVYFIPFLLLPCYFIFFSHQF